MVTRDNEAAVAAHYTMVYTCCRDKRRGCAGHNHEEVHNRRQEADHIDNRRCWEWRLQDQDRSRNRHEVGQGLLEQLNQEAIMPIFILWAGIPILILGGGFVVYRLIGG